MSDPKPTKWLSEGDAVEVVRAFTPVVYQECESPYDFLGKISDSPDVRYDPAPPLYYAVRGNEDSLYILYGFYHRYDPVARHDHDFEGLILEVDRHGCAMFLGSDNPFNFWSMVTGCMTVSHLDFIFSPRAEGVFRIEAGGHAVTIADEPITSEHNVQRYEYFTGVNMERFEEKTWERIDTLFGQSVKTPKKWNDPNLYQWCYRHHPTINGVTYWSVMGLCWEQPEILFEIARRSGRL